MAKPTKRRERASIAKFRKVYMSARQDYEEDERRGLPPEECIRARWSKEDIVRICNWTREWAVLRRLLEDQVGLLLMHAGAPRKDLCWTFATSEQDRERTAVNALSLQVGIAKWTADTVRKQLAPVDGQYALTEDNREHMADVLMKRHNTKLDQIIKSIAEIQNERWIDDVAMLTDTGSRPQPEPMAEETR